VLSKSELKALWREYDFRPLKRLGQNFIVDKNIVEKILRSLDVKPGDTVLEIGAGFGEFTFGLARLAKRVFAVEKDRAIVRILKTAFEIPPNVALLAQDFLGTDIAKIAQGEKVIIYGSLPYYITSPIIEKLIENSPCIKTIYLIVQEEVADRILAKPNTKAIGRLSLFVQYYTEPERIFKIKRASFHPVPGVDSVLLKLDVRKTKKVQVSDESLLFRVIKSAYGQRRKTLLNSLAGLGLPKPELTQLLQTAKIPPTARAETLSLTDFARLTNHLTNLPGSYRRFLTTERTIYRPTRSVKRLV